MDLNTALLSKATKPGDTYSFIMYRCVAVRLNSAAAAVQTDKRSVITEIYTSACGPIKAPE